MRHPFLLSKQISAAIYSGGALLLVPAQNRTKDLGSSAWFVSVRWIGGNIVTALFVFVRIHIGHKVVRLGERDRIVGFYGWLNVILMTILIVEIRLQRLNHGWERSLV